MYTNPTFMICSRQATKWKLPRQSWGWGARKKMVGAMRICRAGGKTFHRNKKYYAIKCCRLLCSICAQVCVSVWGEGITTFIFMIYEPRAILRANPIPSAARQNKSRWVFWVLLKEGRLLRVENASIKRKWRSYIKHTTEQNSTELNWTDNANNSTPISPEHIILIDWRALQWARWPTFKTAKLII